VKRICTSSERLDAILADRSPKRQATETARRAPGPQAGISVRPVKDDLERDVLLEDRDRAPPTEPTNSEIVLRPEMAVHDTLREIRKCGMADR
jgi:hypothetical protein